MILSRFARLASGVMPDLPYGQRLWVTDSNMRYTDGGMRPLPGQYPLTNTLASLPVLGLMEVMDDHETPPTPALYYGDTRSIYEIINTVVYDCSRVASPYIGDRLTTRWSFAQWGKWRLASNGVEPVQIWQKATPATGAFIDIDGAGSSDILSTFTAEVIRVNGPHLLFFNTDNDSAEYVWATADDVTITTPTEANSAGSLIIRELGSEIVAVEAFRDGLAVYGKNKMFFVRNNGFPFYFSHQFLIEGIGAVSKDAVVDVGGMHFGFGQHFIWKTDGATYQMIDDAVHREIYTDLNYNRLEQIVTLHNPSITSVQFFFPTGNSDVVTRGFNYDYKSNAWSELDFVRTAGVPGNAFGYAVNGTLDGDILVQANPASGTVPSSSLPLGIGDKIAIDYIAEYGGTPTTHEAFYGDGFYGGHYESVPIIPDDIIIVVVTDVLILLTMNGVTIPIGAVSDTATCFVESDWLEFSQSDAAKGSLRASNIMKFIDYIRVVLENKDLAANFQLTISYTNSLDDEGTVMAPILFSALLGTDLPSKLLDGNIYDGLPDEEAVYFKFRFEDTKIVDPSWHLTELEVLGEYIGEFV